MAGTKVRLFVAVEVPQDRRAALDSALASFKAANPSLRFTKVENQHVTLKFLGWLEPEQVDAAQTMCEEIAVAHTAGRAALAELGAFPSLRRARVLWAGLSDPDGTCASLAEALDARAEELGVEREGRVFVPHLTLARAKRPRPAEDLPQVPEEAGRSFEVEEIVLFRSHLSSEGARYEVIQRWPLGWTAETR